MLRRLFLSFAVALALGAMPTARLCAQQAYTLTDIGSWEGPMSINASGQVTGTTVVGTLQGFRWNPNSPNSALGTLSVLALPKGATNSHGNAINSKGEVAGRTFKAVANRLSNEYATYWNANGSPAIIKPASGGFSNAFGINDPGQLVGQAIFSNNTYQAFLWTAGKLVNIGSTVSSGPSTASSINTYGTVLGSYTLSDGSSQPFLWTPNVSNGPIGTVSVLNQIIVDTSTSHVLNDAGQIVGRDSASGQAAIFDPANGSVQDLDPTGVFYGSFGWASNNVGQVVGSGDIGYSVYGFNVQAFLWDPISGMRNLMDPTQFSIYDTSGNPISGVNLMVAYDVNDKGQIVGYLKNSANQLRIYLLTPR